MTYLFFIIAGAVIAALVLLFSVRFPDGRAEKFFAGSLIIAALIYAGFAISGVMNETASTGWILLEMSGVLLFTLIGFLGVKISPLILAFGWAAHVLWDVIFRHGGEISYVPEFYPPVCIGFDLVFALYIVYRFYIKVKD